MNIPAFEIRENQPEAVSILLPLKEWAIADFKSSGNIDRLIEANMQPVEGDAAVQILTEEAISQVQKVQYVTKSAQKILDRYEFARAGGWVAFGCTIDGETGQVGYFKPRQPRLDFEKSQPIKYETPAKCPATPVLPWVDSESAQKIYQKYGISPQDGETFWQCVKRCNIEIAFTEGLKKALCLLDCGYPAIALRGAYNWHIKGDSEFHPVQKEFATAGRKITIVFDQDSKPKTIANVNTQITKFGYALSAVGCEVFVTHWDAGQAKGIDDLFVGGYAESEAEITVSLCQIHKAEKAVSFVLDNAYTFDVWKREVSQPKLEKEPKPQKEKPKSPTKSASGGLHLDLFGDHKVAEIVRRNFDRVMGQPIGDLICVNHRLHQWTGTHYQFVEDGIVKRKILEFIRQLYFWRLKENPETGEETWVESYPYGSDRFAAECLASVKSSRFLPLDAIPRTGLNLANGTLLVSCESGQPEFTLHPHSRDRYYLQCSKTPYDPNADTTQADRLLSAVKADQLETFLRHQSMFFDFPGTAKKIGRPRAGICEGEGSNGKDAIRQSIEHLFGRIGNFAFEDFRQYDDGKRFSLATMPNYQYSWASENSHKVKLENLKSLMSAIVGNSALWSEYKNKDLQEYYPQVCLWFSVNKAPVTDGAASFIRSRFAVYQFDKVFTKVPIASNELEADPRFAYDEDFRVNEVCPGLLRRLIEAHQRLWVEGIEWEDCEGRLSDWAKEHNHLLEFAETIGLVKESSGQIAISALYDSLKDWYRVNDYLDVDADGRHRWLEAPSHFDSLVKRTNDLFKRLKELFPGIEKCTDTDGSVTGCKGRAYIRGLAIKKLEQLPPDATPQTQPVEEPVQATEAETEQFTIAENEEIESCVLMAEDAAKSNDRQVVSSVYSVFKECLKDRRLKKAVWSRLSIMAREAMNKARQASSGGISNVT